MQPLKLVIPGSYWDSQLYEGRLYLFGRAGDLLALNWDSLIESFSVPEPLQLAIACAFQRSDYLYGMASAGLMRDSEIRSIVTNKFARLGDLELEVSKNRMRRHFVGRQENPLPFPHTDCEIYFRKMYVASKSGVKVATCNKRTRHPVSTRPDRIWDAPVLGLSASYGTLALAAGSEGLFEKNVIDHGWKSHSSDEPSRISEAHCSDCGWAFYSIFGSSSLGSGFLAAYERQEVGDRPRLPRRLFDRLIDDTEIFGPQPQTTRPAYSWASQDKLCRAIDGTVEVRRYAPWHHDEQRRIEPLGALEFAARNGGVVSAAVALFGTVLELDSAVLVLPSAGQRLLLRGEPINWRVFPRSKHYENQLHVVYDDRLEILSFNHDYLVDQDRKISGTRYYAGSGVSVRAL